MRLVRRKPFLTRSQVTDMGLQELTAIVKKEDKTQPLRGDILQYAGTILDSIIDVKGGAVPIPTDFKIINIFAVRKRIDDQYLVLKRENFFSHISKNCKDLIYQTEGECFIYVPKGFSSFFITEIGVNVMTGIQKRYDDMLYYYQKWDKNHDTVTNIDWLIAYTRLIVEINKVKQHKGGLYDNAVGCIWPYSMRGVVVPDPSLELNEIAIPSKVIRSWVAKKEFRDAYNIPEELSNRDAAKTMHGRRVLIGRQPSHDPSNLLSFKLKVT